MNHLLKENKNLDTADNRLLLKSLESSLVKRKSAPGSIEEIIDEMIDCRSIDATLEEDGGDDRYLRLLQLGFEAVPTYIKHLEDERLTRSRELS